MNEDAEFAGAIKMLPEALGNAIAKTVKDTRKISEIRIRRGRNIVLTVSGRNEMTDIFTDGECLRRIFMRLCGNSVYAHSADIRQGFVTAEGGHRVGIAGSAVTENGGIRTLTSISSVNIRIARHIETAADAIMPYILKNGRIMNTLLIGVPLSGKTTVLRAAAVRLSEAGKRTAVIDERRELSAFGEGKIPADNMDIFVGYPRADGIEQALRCFSPDVIIFDELGNEKDIAGLTAAANAGVSIVTTAHANGFEQLKRRQLFARIINEKIFDVAVSLGSGIYIGRAEDIRIL